MIFHIKDATGAGRFVVEIAICQALACFVFIYGRLCATCSCDFVKLIFICTRQFGPNMCCEEWIAEIKSSTGAFRPTLLPPPRHSMRSRPFSSLSASRHRRRQHQELLAGLQLPRHVLQSRQFRDQLRAEGRVHARRQSIKPSANNNNPPFLMRSACNTARSRIRVLLPFFPFLPFPSPHFTNLAGAVARRRYSLRLHVFLLQFASMPLNT